jgi:hypothetical protein
MTRHIKGWAVGEKEAQNVHRKREDALFWDEIKTGCFPAFLSAAKPRRPLFPPSKKRREKSPF